MNELLKKAKQRLDEGGYTCVLMSECGHVLESEERGVKPLLDLLKTGRDFTDYVAADKTVGAGAAHLYVLLKVSMLWTNVVSEIALEILKKNGISVFFGQCVPYIINRRGDGVCPIEEAVASANTSEEAYHLIIHTLERLAAKQASDNSETNADGETVKIFKALADDNRLEIIKLLKSGEKCGCKLLDALNIGQPTLSHHMRILCEAGIVTFRKEGKWTYYSLLPQGFKRTMDLLEGYTNNN